MKTVVIFMEPQVPGNIGFLARTMKNFGVEDLLLVDPDCEITEETKARAMHAQDILEDAEEMENLDKALNSVDMSVATTSNPKGFLPSNLAEKASSRKGKLGLVFGREDNGLTNQEIKKCDLVAHIPASEEYGTLNVTHAAAVFFYEMFRRTYEEEKRVKMSSKIGLVDSFRYLAEHDKVGFSNPDGAVKMFRNVISRAFVTSQEARAVKGVFENIKEDL